MANADKEQIGKVLGSVPSGCCILTAAAGGCSTGILASWFQQASFEPPMISIAVRKGRPIEKIIDQSGHFTANILGEADAQEMFKHFAKGFELDELAFEGLRIRSAPHGVIVESCLGYLGCKVVSKVPAGDHNVYLGEIVDAASLKSGPAYVHLRKTGLSY